MTCPAHIPCALLVPTRLLAGQRTFARDGLSDHKAHFLSAYLTLRSALPYVQDYIVIDSDDDLVITGSVPPPRKPKGPVVEIV